VVAEQAMTCRGLAVGVAAWFGREALLDLVEWDEFERRVGAEHAATTLDHIDRSITADIERSRAILGYVPRYSSLEALRESLRWQVEHGRADVAGQAF
jgi:nucleoside-diphosphate-sugar epimerase